MFSKLFFLMEVFYIYIYLFKFFLKKKQFFLYILKKNINFFFCTPCVQPPKGGQLQSLRVACATPKGGLAAVVVCSPQRGGWWQLLCTACVAPKGGLVAETMHATPKGVGSAMHQIPYRGHASVALGHAAPKGGVGSNNHTSDALRRSCKCDPRATFIKKKSFILKKPALCPNRLAPSPSTSSTCKHNPQNLMRIHTSSWMYIFFHVVQRLPSWF